MDQAIKARWVEALRSGEYQQTDGTLKDENGHCCLGVLCEVERPPEAIIRAARIEIQLKADADEKDVEEANATDDFCLDAILSRQLAERWGLSGYTEVLAAMNDSVAATFDEIADWIEAYL